MNENIDLTKILKDCPIGWKFYSSVYGGVIFEKIESCRIIFKLELNYTEFKVHSNGKYTVISDAECVIFPSKDQRDWSKFTAPWYKKERFDPKTLQPYDKVLVKDKFSEWWRCAFFSHIRKEEEATLYRYATTSNVCVHCIPYNDDTKHLVGTYNEAPEFYRYWED